MWVNNFSKILMLITAACHPDRCERSEKEMISLYDPSHTFGLTRKNS